MSKIKLLKGSFKVNKELALNSPIFQLVEEFSRLKDNLDGEEALARSKKALQKVLKVAILLSKRSNYLPYRSWTKY